MTDTPAVYGAFAKALQQVRSVGKDGWNDHQRFNFRGIDGVLDAVGPAFRAHDLFLIPEVVDHRLELVRSSQGKEMVQAVLRMKYTVAHADGSTLSGTIVGEATDRADKATSKAASVALRTFLLQSMVLPTGEKDPDADYNERGATPAPETLLYESPGWDPETASKQQLAVALRQAQANGNTEIESKLREVGKRRFPAKSNNPETQEQ